MPHSSDPEYAERAIPQYELAVQLAGGEPVRISLDQPAAEIVIMVRAASQLAFRAFPPLRRLAAMRPPCLV